jgi:hypothetical protein
MKNLINRQQLLFTETEWHSKFGSNLGKIHWEKHPRAFVKVVEGSEIYNFPIHHFVHFYSKFWSILLSNRASWNGWRHGATSWRPERQARPRHAVRAVPPARAPRRVALPETAPPEIGTHIEHRGNPRRRVSRPGKRARQTPPSLWVASTHRGRRQ